LLPLGEQAPMEASVSNEAEEAEGGAQQGSGAQDKHAQVGDGVVGGCDGSAEIEGAQDGSSEDIDPSVEGEDGADTQQDVLLLNDDNSTDEDDDDDDDDDDDSDDDADDSGDDDSDDDADDSDEDDVSFDQLVTRN
jgi:hypothetical protein